MVIAVDFDGTIVTHEYPAIGKPIPFAIETLNKLQQEDHPHLILWTVREGDLLKEAVDYCASRGVEFYAINSNFPNDELIPAASRKLNADIFIDDHNLGGLPDWGIIYRMIHEGKALRPIPTSNIEEKKPKSLFERIFG